VIPSVISAPVVDEYDLILEPTAVCSLYVFKIEHGKDLFELLVGVGPLGITDRHTVTLNDPMELSRAAMSNDWSKHLAPLLIGKAPHSPLFVKMVAVAIVSEAGLQDMIGTSLVDTLEGTTTKLLVVVAYVAYTRNAGDLTLDTRDTVAHDAQPSKALSNLTAS
jgi:hypothetical protein